MNTLIRSTTLAFSSRRRAEDYYGYEILDRSSGMGNIQNDQFWGGSGGGGGGTGARRASSKRRKDQPYMMSSVSYRRDRAKKRQIFLRSYQLSSIETKTSPVQSTSRRLKKAFVKVKSALVKIVGFARIDALRSCAVSGPPAICGSAPRSVIQSVRRVVRK